MSVAVGFRPWAAWMLVSCHSVNAQMVLESRPLHMPGSRGRLGKQARGVTYRAEKTYWSTRTSCCGFLQTRVRSEGRSLPCSTRGQKREVHMTQTEICWIMTEVLWTKKHCTGRKQVNLYGSPWDELQWRFKREKCKFPNSSLRGLHCFFLFSIFANPFPL